MIVGAPTSRSLPRNLGSLKRFSTMLRVDPFGPLTCKSPIETTGEVFQARESTILKPAEWTKMFGMIWLIGANGFSTLLFSIR